LAADHQAYPQDRTQDRENEGMTGKRFLWVTIKGSWTFFVLTASMLAEALSVAFRVPDDDQLGYLPCSNRQGSD
jgi:hypothetical protein